MAPIHGLKKVASSVQQTPTAVIIPSKVNNVEHGGTNRAAQVTTPTQTATFINSTSAPVGVHQVVYINAISAGSSQRSQNLPLLQQPHQMINLGADVSAQHRLLAPRIVVGEQPVPLGINLQAAGARTGSHLLVRTETGQYRLLPICGSQVGISSVPAQNVTLLKQAQGVHQHQQSIPTTSSVIVNQTGTGTANRLLGAATTVSPALAGTTLMTTTSNTSTGISGKMTPDAAKLKCQNLFVTLLRLTRKERPKLVATNVQKLIQCLIDAEIEPEVFTTNLQWVLNSSPQSSLIPFLKMGLPYLRHSLATKELIIGGIRSPLISTVTTNSLQQQPFVIKQVQGATRVQPVRPMGADLSLNTTQQALPNTNGTLKEMNFVTANDIHATSSPIKEVSWLNGSNRLPNPDEVEVVEISKERDQEKTEIKCICERKSSDLTVICGQCEDSFHCACVGISEVMRIRLERKEADWFCPRCNLKESPIMHKAKLVHMVNTMIQQFPIVNQKSSVGSAPQLNDSTYSLPLKDVSSSLEVHISTDQEEESKCRVELAKLASDIKLAQKRLSETHRILVSRSINVDYLRKKIEQLESKDRTESIKRNQFLEKMDRLKKQRLELTRQKDQLKQELNDLKEAPAEKKIKLEDANSNTSAVLWKIQQKEAELSDVKVELALIVDEANNLLVRIRGVDQELAEYGRYLTQTSAELDSLVGDSTAGSSPSSIAAQWKTLKKEQRDRIAEFCSLEKKLFQISCDHVFDEIRRKEEEWVNALSDCDDD